MIRTQIYLPNDLHRDLRLLANVSKKNISVLLREGASLLLKNESKKKRKAGWDKFVGGAKTKKKLKKTGTDLIREYYEKFGE